VLRTGTNDDAQSGLNALDPKTGCFLASSLPTKGFVFPLSLSPRGEGGATAPGEVLKETRVRVHAVDRRLQQPAREIGANYAGTVVSDFAEARIHRLNE
jgi:hypothetical protein